jgi:hypothetical protein
MTAPAIYEVLIRGTETGEIAGAHVCVWEADGTDRNGNTRYAPSAPTPLHLADVADTLTGGLYAAGAQFTRMEAEIAALKTDKTALEAEVATLTTGKAALDAEIAALKAEIEALKAPAAQDDPAAV